jgi:hypothetical protein
MAPKEKKNGKTVNSERTSGRKARTHQKGKYQLCSKDSQTYPEYEENNLQEQEGRLLDIDVHI